jgi:hypothetical protein
MAMADFPLMRIDGFTLWMDEVRVATLDNDILGPCLVVTRLGLGVIYVGKG